MEQTRKEKLLISTRLRKEKHLNDKQFQVCIGGLLGDSSLNVRNNGQCRLKMCHCEKQYDYLEFKKKIMEPFYLQEKPTKDYNENKKWKTSPCYHYNSIVHQDFTNLYGLFYKKTNGLKCKYININILKKLQPIGIVIWYLDEGCYFFDEKKRSHKLYLSTYCYSLSEHQIIKKWFKKDYGIDSTITFDKFHSLYYLRFNIDGIKKFTKIFLDPYKEIIPSCMHYKFPTLN